MNFFSNSTRPAAKLQEHAPVIVSSITELMLAGFITCLVDDDLTPLDKHKFGVAEHLLRKAWNKIYEEYIEATQDKEQQQYMRLAKEVIVLDTRFKMVQACLEVLSYAFDKEILTELKKWTAVRERFDPNDPEQYKKDITAVDLRSRKLLTDIRHRQSEIERVMPKGEGKADKFYFEKVIVQLEKHMGKPIDKWNTTVANFAFMLQDYRNACKAAEQLVKKR